MKRLDAVLKQIKPVDGKLDQEIQRRLDHLTKPVGSLGRLEELAKTLCRIRGEIISGLDRKVIVVFAADHGVVEEGVSAYPQEVTAQMVANFAAGGAAINVLARQVGAEVVVVDAGVKSPVKFKSVRQKKVAPGTANMAQGPAMTLEQARRSLELGMETVSELHSEKPISILGLGEMGIGNTTAATAVLAALTGEAVEKITGLGTGISSDGKKKKVAAIEKALKINNPNQKNGLDILRKVGGFEIGAIAGAILAAAANRIPVAVDGLISTAGALIACSLAPRSVDILIASHQSVEPGHQKMLQVLKLEPYLDMNLRLGEGTGSALLMGLADASLKILSEMATFDSAGVSKKK